MGVNNRQRRKAKQKDRARPRQRTGPPAEDVDAPPWTAQDRVIASVRTATEAIESGDPAALETALSVLDQNRPGWSATVDRVLLALLHRSLGFLWAHGWQPADVVRLVQRRSGSAPAQLATDLIAAERANYATGTVAEEWDAQLSTLNAAIWWPSTMNYVDAYLDRNRVPRPVFLRRAVEIFAVLSTVPKLESLIPPPGTARRGSLGPESAGDRAAEASANARMRDRVLALLAKAESTEFAEEAEALTAKAQELMARYSIDYAMLAARGGDKHKPIGIRIGIDNPYEDAKASLLQRVAEANRCRTVFTKTLGFSTVVGYRRDASAVELMFTSLLVQATSAMIAEGARSRKAADARSRSFRQSFLLAYAARIGQRLAGVTEQVSRSAAESDAALLPVLRSVDESVEQAMTDLFGNVVSSPVRSSYHHGGWVSGTAAADLADVGIREGVAAT